MALHRTVDDLKDTMTGVEFLNWLAYYELHPFGTEWDDVRIAVLSANIVRALTGKAQRIADHLATYGRQERKQTPQQQINILETLRVQAERAAKAKTNG